MSAWRVGARLDAPPPADPADPGPIQTTIDQLTKWIPGDAIALYVAGVTALSAGTNAKPSIPLLVVFILFAGALVVAGAFATGAKIPKATTVSAVLSSGAFTIWSLSVPFSGWQHLDFVDDNQVAVSLTAALAGSLFGLVAEGVSKRAG